MLDQLFLKKLTKKGRRMYWVIQIVIDILYIASLFLFFDFTMDKISNDGYPTVIIGILISMLLSGVICLNFWKKPKDIV